MPKLGSLSVLLFMVLLLLSGASSFAANHQASDYLNTSQEEQVSESKCEAGDTQWAIAGITLACIYGSLLLGTVASIAVPIACCGAFKRIQTLLSVRVLPADSAEQS